MDSRQTRHRYRPRGRSRCSRPFDEQPRYVPAHRARACPRSDAWPTSEGASDLDPLAAAISLDHGNLGALIAHRRPLSGMMLTKLVSVPDGEKWFRQVPGSRQTSPHRATTHPLRMSRGSRVAPRPRIGRRERRRAVRCNSPGRGCSAGCTSPYPRVRDRALRFACEGESVPGQRPQRLPSALGAAPSCLRVSGGTGPSTAQSPE